MSHARNSRPLALIALLIVTALLLAMSRKVISASGDSTYLGPPANITSTNSYFPLSGFHRIPTVLRRSGKPELLLLEAQGKYYMHIIVERWPVVKALSQFGRLSGVKIVNSVCVTVQGGPASGEQSCTVPSFDLSHARYSSRYLTFVVKDLIRDVGTKSKPYQPMSSTERGLYNRYVRYRGKLQCVKLDSSGKPIKGPNGQLVLYACSSLVDTVQAAINDNTDTRTLPLITVGGYLQTASQLMNEGDFSQPISVTPTHPGQSFAFYNRVFSFDTDRQALVSGKDTVPTSRLVESVNAEANIMTALVCHADGMRPKSVCGRSALKQILKHVKEERGARSLH